MKRMIVLLFILLLSTNSPAALPPQYQNSRDLDVITAFIKKHEKVISTLTSVDFEKFVIYFEDDCKAIFARKEIPKPSGWVGPADPLEFKFSTCSLD
ncbi:hypothetical protein [Psychromonas ossibalaenae]|uniref:hypothetical protein n=1 Tax=Psychromonas ossibalaenae TaxID=444922 RepID=UPI0004777BC6|nr:hypothetical protein [Psychromonas ossibalaenae]